MNTIFIEDLRNLSAAVYAFILLVIGIPLWWRMTEVQRHSLPYAQISQLGSIDVMISTDIFVYTNNPNESKHIIKQIYTTFNSSTLKINTYKMCICDKLNKTYSSSYVHYQC